MYPRTLSRFVPNVRSFGPYVLMELLLPGGTLLALLLWISQGMARGGLLGVYLPVVSPSAVERVVAPAHPERRGEELVHG